MQKVPIFVMVLACAYAPSHTWAQTRLEKSNAISTGVPALAKPIPGGTVTTQPTTRSVQSAKPGPTEASSEFIIGNTSKLNAGDQQKNLQTQQGQLQQLKTQKQNSAIRSCRTC